MVKKKIENKNGREEKKTKSEQLKIKKRYKKPELEKHSDIDLWAFGTMGG